MSDNKIKLNLTEDQLMDAFNKAEYIKCNCGNDTFDRSFMFKKISKLISPNGEDMIIPIETFICRKCGYNMVDDLLNKNSGGNSNGLL